MNKLFAAFLQFIRNKLETSLKLNIKRFHSAWSAIGSIQRPPKRKVIVDKQALCGVIFWKTSMQQEFVMVYLWQFYNNSAFLRRKVAEKTRDSFAVGDCWKRRNRHV